MAVTRAEIDRITALAKLSPNAGEGEQLASDLGRILDYVKKLNEIDTSGVAPLSHPGEQENVLRSDQLQPSLPVEEVMKNAPAHHSGFFKVPKVIK